MSMQETKSVAVSPLSVTYVALLRKYARSERKGVESCVAKLLKGGLDRLSSCRKGIKHPA